MKNSLINLETVQKHCRNSFIIENSYFPQLLYVYYREFNAFFLPLKLCIFSTVNNNFPVDEPLCLLSLENCELCCLNLKFTNYLKLYLCFLNQFMQRKFLKKETNFLTFQEKIGFVVAIHLLMVDLIGKKFNFQTRCPKLRYKVALHTFLTNVNQIKHILRKFRLSCYLLLA